MMMMMMKIEPQGSVCTIINKSGLPQLTVSSLPCHLGKQQMSRAIRHRVSLHFLKSMFELDIFHPYDIRYTQRHQAASIRHHRPDLLDLSSYSAVIIKNNIPQNQHDNAVLEYPH